jgi:O-antigen/teichoic acid export membrane protein
MTDLGKTSRLRGGIAASASASLVSIVAGLGLLPVIIRTVGAGPYGLWLLLSTFATYLYQADLGMGAGLVHFLSRRRDAGQEMHRRIVSTGVVWMGVAGLAATPVYAAIALWIVAEKGSNAGVSHSDGVTLVALGSVLVAALGLRAFPSALAGYGFWVYQRGSQTIGTVVRTVGTLVACLVMRSLVAVAAAESLALIVPALLCTVRAWRLGLVTSPRRSWDRDLARTMLRYSRRAFVVGAMAIILLQADTLIVGVVASASAVTYYGAALRLFATIVQVVQWLSDPLMPALSRMYEENRVRARDMFSGMLFATLWTATGACGALMIGSPLIFRLWLGKSAPVHELVPILCALMASLILSSSHEAAIPASDATGEPGAFASLFVWWACTNVALSLGLGYLIGPVGVALGTLLPLIALEPLFVRRMERRLDLAWRPWVRTCVRPVLSVAGSALMISAVAFGVTWLVGVASDWRFGIASIVFAGTYVIATVRLRESLPLKSVQTMLNAHI